MQHATDSGTRRSEIVAAIALAADLGLGQPLDHVLRSCVPSRSEAEASEAALGARHPARVA